jgi:uncharacterized membrane protein
MFTAHLHLAINHFAIIGSFIGSLILFYGYIKKNQEIYKISCIIFFIALIAAIVTFITGEGAERAVETLGITEEMIEPHERIALFALITVSFLGLFSFITLVKIKENSRQVKSLVVIMLCISIVSFVLFGWTGYLGGSITHKELNNKVDIKKIEK